MRSGAAIGRSARLLDHTPDAVDVPRRSRSGRPDRHTELLGPHPVRRGLRCDRRGHLRRAPPHARRLGRAAGATPVRAHGPGRTRVAGGARTGVGRLVLDTRTADARYGDLRGGLLCYLVTTEQLTEDPQSRDVDVRGSGLLAAGILVMNVATFGFQILAARILGPENYSGINSMLSLLLVVAVLQLGLQATAARRVAEAPGDVRAIERTMKAVTNRAAITITVLMLALSPLVEYGLKLPNIWPALLVAVCAYPITIWGGQAGILQGERRWRELALLYLANGVPRLVLGPIFMLVHPTETSAMLAVTIAQFAPTIVGYWVLREKHVHEAHPDMKGAVAESLHGSFALLGFFALANIDAIAISKHTLDARNAGLYAAGLIVAKVVLFLPQSVIVLVFPSMS